MLDFLNWNQYFPGFVCRCAKEAEKMGYDLFGVQNYGKEFIVMFFIKRSYFVLNRLLGGTLPIDKALSFLSNQNARKKYYLILVVSRFILLLNKLANCADSYNEPPHHFFPIS